jgi:hypothetical protein
MLIIFVVFVKCDDKINSIFLACQQEEDKTSIHYMYIDEDYMSIHLM